MKPLIICVCSLAMLAACTPTTPGTSGTAVPTSTPGGATVPIAGGLDDAPVYGPVGLVCVGELQNQTLSGTSTTTFDFVRADHARIDVTRGTYTTSFQAASGCNEDGEPITFGPVLGPTTVNFTVTYVGAFVREEDPVCIAGSLIVFSNFDTAAGPVLDAVTQAMSQDRIHRHLDRQLAVTMQGIVGDPDTEVEQARCDDWAPLVPADFGL